MIQLYIEIDLLLLYIEIDLACELLLQLIRPRKSACLKQASVRYTQTDTGTGTDTYV